ncbi:MAG TPA: hypothetical protein VJ863_06505, partial [Sphaerochaeta sp.]|nr:hypothetical protein [Sphaerochaeta sp.]
FTRLGPRVQEALNVVKQRSVLYLIGLLIHSFWYFLPLFWISLVFMGMYTTNSPYFTVKQWFLKVGTPSALVLV